MGDHVISVVDFRLWS